MLDREVLASLKQANPIVSVAERLGLTVVGGKCRCLYPERHKSGDRSPSLSFSPERGTFRCWVCPDVKGDVISLVQLVRGIGFLEAVAWLGGDGDVRGGPVVKDVRRPQLSSQGLHKIEQKNKDRDESLTAVLEDFYSLLEPVDGLAMRYLQGRRIFRKGVERGRVRMIPDSRHYGRVLEKRWDRSVLVQSGLFHPERGFRFWNHPLVFPYFDMQGRLSTLQCRAIESSAVVKELLLPGPVAVPFNVRILASNIGHVFLTEGVVDALTLLERDMPAVAVPGANAFKADWVTYFRDKTVDIVFDDDAPGREGAVRVEKLLRDAGIRAFVVPPIGGSDVNEGFRRR